jgi:hypothetical protein
MQSASTKVSRVPKCGLVGTWRGNITIPDGAGGISAVAILRFSEYGHNVVVKGSANNKPLAIQNAMSSCTDFSLSFRREKYRRSFLAGFGRWPVRGRNGKAPRLHHDLEPSKTMSFCFQSGECQTNRVPKCIPANRAWRVSECAISGLRLSPFGTGAWGCNYPILHEGEHGAESESRLYGKLCLRAYDLQTTLKLFAEGSPSAEVRASTSATTLLPSTVVAFKPLRLPPNGLIIGPRAAKSSVVGLGINKFQPRDQALSGHVGVGVGQAGNGIVEAKAKLLVEAPSMDFTELCVRAARN